MKLDKANSETERKLKKLIEDHGFTLSGGVIRNKPLPYYPSNVFGHAEDYFRATDILCPIVREGDFTDRLVKIMKY